MRLFLFSFFLIPLVFAQGAIAQLLSEEARVQGFYEHQRKNRQLDQSREAGIQEVKKKREKWNEALEKAIPEFKTWKSHQGATPGEDSVEYKQDLKTKEQGIRDRELALQEFLRKKKWADAQEKKARILVPEDEELGLVESSARLEESPSSGSPEPTISLDEIPGLKKSDLNESPEEIPESENLDSPYYAEPEPPPPEVYEQQAPPLGDIYEEEGIEPPPVREFINPSPPMFEEEEVPEF